MAEKKYYEVASLDRTAFERDKFSNLVEYDKFRYNNSENGGVISKFEQLRNFTNELGPIKDALVNDYKDIQETYGDFDAFDVSIEHYQNQFGTQIDKLVQAVDDIRDYLQKALEDKAKEDEKYVADIEQLNDALGIAYNDASATDAEWDN